MPGDSRLCLFEMAEHVYPHVPWSRLWEALKGPMSYPKKFGRFANAQKRDVVGPWGAIQERLSGRSFAVSAPSFI